MVFLVLERVETVSVVIFDVFYLSLLIGPYSQRQRLFNWLFVVYPAVLIGLEAIDSGFS
jgi:hypothetical protein